MTNACNLILKLTHFVAYSFLGRLHYSVLSPSCAMWASSFGGYGDLCWCKRMTATSWSHCCTQVGDLHRCRGHYQSLAEDYCTTTHLSSPIHCCGDSVTLAVRPRSTVVAASIRNRPHHRYRLHCSLHFGCVMNRRATVFPQSFVENCNERRKWKMLIMVASCAHATHYTLRNCRRLKLFHVWEDFICTLSNVASVCLSVIIKVHWNFIKEAAASDWESLLN